MTNVLNRTALGVLLTLSFVLCSTLAFARPAEITAEATNDDATVKITVLDQALVLAATDTGDDVSWCQLEVTIEGTKVAFTQGDSYRIRVMENDFVGDDTVYDRTVDVTSAEVAANRVDRTFNCSENFGYDGFGSNLEIYGRVQVTKDECGFFCQQDDARTSDLDVAEIYGDDVGEPDDTSAAANLAGLGKTLDRISKDQDWYKFTLSGPSDIVIKVEHRPVAGRIEATLYDPNDNVLSAGSNETDSTKIEQSALPAGTYTLRLLPRDTTNPNFYDLDLAVTAAQTDCTPGDTESRDCGDCGTEMRTCQNTGDWGAYGGCMNEGVCSPGDTEMMNCTDGTQTRTCDQACQWEPYGACMGTECSAGDTEPCYSGPDGTVDVGICQAGMRSCTNGMFGTCMGEVVPAAEVCGDGVDNDCDGATDMDDDDCDPERVPEVGSECDDDSQCGELTCLVAPENAKFIDGYCSETGCTAGEPCGVDNEGVCVQDEENFCLSLCNDDNDCRPGYRCTSLPDGDQVCYPGCTVDAQCSIESLSSCENGSCSAPASNNNNTGNNTTGNNTPGNNTPGNNTPGNNTPGNNTPGNNTTPNNSTGNNDTNGADEDHPDVMIPSEPGCGCASGPGEAPGGSAILLLLAAALVSIRRHFSGNDTLEAK